MGSVILEVGGEEGIVGVCRCSGFRSGRGRRDEWEEGKQGEEVHGVIVEKVVIIYGRAAEVMWKERTSRGRPGLARRAIVARKVSEEKE